MTATPAFALSCDARADGAWCPRRVVLVGALDVVRKLAEANGWRCDGDEDFCPDHAGTDAGGLW